MNDRYKDRDFLFYSIRAVHLSNVAVQQNYLNGKRHDSLPENNFMTSDDFVEYLEYVNYRSRCISCLEYTVVADFLGFLSVRTKAKATHGKR